jgi:transposase
MDTKANVKIGPFSRGGYNRQGDGACDHDFKPDTVLTPFGIFLPKIDETYFYFTQSNVTADFMVDSLEDLWPMIKIRFNPHTIVINADNGPENHSRRTQFMKRLVDFARKNEVSLRLVYYPPYHSKYNPIERVWGVLEYHWRGQIIDSVEKALGLAKTMTYNGNHPMVKLVSRKYEKGIKLTQKAMQNIENMIERLPGIEKWAVEIPCY